MKTSTTCFLLSILALGHVALSVSALDDFTAPQPGRKLLSPGFFGLNFPGRSLAGMGGNAGGNKGNQGGDGGGQGSTDVVGDTGTTVTVSSDGNTVQELPANNNQVVFGSNQPFTFTSQGGTFAPNSDEQAALRNLPTNEFMASTNVDTSIAADTFNKVQSAMNQGNDHSAAAQAAFDHLTSGNDGSTVSVSKGMADFLSAHGDKAGDIGKSFGELVIKAKDDEKTVIKCVHSVTVTVVLLIVKKQVEVAKTCFSSFISFLVAKKQCDVFVVKVVEIFIKLITAVVVPTHPNVSYDG